LDAHWHGKGPYVTLDGQQYSPWKFFSASFYKKGEFKYMRSRVTLGFSPHTPSFNKTRGPFLESPGKFSGP